MSKVYQIVTDRITAALEAGTVPWHKPWATQGGLPRNLSTGKRYRGVNCFLLALSPYDSPYWLTYKQAQALGGQVRKGEKATPIVFWTEWETKDKQTGDDIKLSVLRYYSAFNIAQCDGLADKLPEQAAFGSDQYGREELIAEMGEAFLCGEAGIDNATIDNQSSYIQGWLKVIRKDIRLVATAAAQAQKAADLILDRFGVKGGVL